MLPNCFGGGWRHGSCSNLHGFQGELHGLLDAKGGAAGAAAGAHRAAPASGSPESRGCETAGSLSRADGLPLLRKTLAAYVLDP